MNMVNMNEIKWTQEIKGIWKAVIGAAEKLTPLSAAGIKPRMEGLSSMGEAAFPFAPDEIGVLAGGRKTVIHLPLDKDEKIYGLGLQFMRMNHRGRTRFLRVNSDPKQDTGETHAPVPLFISSRGYGVLVNTANIVTIYCGSSVLKKSKNPPVPRDRNTDRNWCATPLSDTLEIVVAADGVELLVFGGEKPLDAVCRYNLYAGGGVLPPRWGLGFWHRVPALYNAEQVMEEALEYRKRDFPCDVIGLEPGWHSKSYPNTYKWSEERFPDPAGFVAGMEDKGFKINLWENPYISPESPIYSELEPLSGSHTVWGGLAPDFSLQGARTIYSDYHQKEHIDIGVSGYKLDECDGSELTGSSWMFPGHAEFPSGLDGEKMRQLYGILLQKMTAELFRKKNRRTYGLVRASNAGSSSLPYVLYSDLYDHKQFIRALCNAGFSGLLWTPEVRKAASIEEWVRRMQSVCFSPLAMLNAWADGTKPWSYPEAEEIIRKYIKLRMQLMPYFYSAFARYHFEGVPPFRAMCLESGTRVQSGDPLSSGMDSSDGAYGHIFNTDLDDQYMAGDSMLVAPLFAGEHSRKVFLPSGIWYDFETGEAFQGGGYVTIQASLDRIPVFVRDGAIIPMMPALSHAPAQGEQVPLEVRHYGASAGEFRLFDDDGETYAYERGAYRWRIIRVQAGEYGERHGSITEPGDEWVSSYGPVTWNFIG